MNEKTKKILLVSSGIIGAIGLGYVVLMLFRKKPSSFGEAVTDVQETIVSMPNAVSSAITGKYTNTDFPLKKGSGSENVMDLQKFLNKEGGFNLVVDGKFGTKTEDALIQIQTPFSQFKSMHPEAVKGQVSESFFYEYIVPKKNDPIASIGLKMSIPNSPITTGTSNSTLS